MDNLKFEYFVNEEKKTVVCKMTVPEGYVYEEVKNILYNNGFYGYDLEQVVTLSMYNSYKGISKCHPEDHFDEKIGKRIAKLRALMQFNDDKYKVLEYIFDNVCNAARAIEAAWEYAGYKYHDQDIELNELVDPEQGHCDDTDIIE